MKFFNESPLKMMKNAFYFTLKVLFALKLFKFCLDFLVFWLYRKNGLNRKTRLIWKLVNKQLQYTYCPISHKVRATKEIYEQYQQRNYQHSNKNIFLQKSCRKCAREISTWLFFVFQKSFKWVKSKWPAA